MKKNQLNMIIAVCLAAVIPVPEAEAVTLNSGDTIAPPAGMSALVFYHLNILSESANLKGLGDFHDQTGLKAQYDVLRYAHFFKLGDFTVGIEVGDGFTNADNVRLGGASLGNIKGFFDPYVIAPIWLVNKPKSRTYFGVAPYFWFPVGEYDSNRTLNAGENRWRGTLQTGFSQGFYDNFTLELAFDATFFGDNSEYGSSHARLEQNNAYEAQGRLRWDFVPETYFSIGYSHLFGGKQYVNNAPNGFRTDKDQVRMEVGHWLTPNLQIIDFLAHDIRISGGFKEQIENWVRVAYIW